MKRVFVDSGAFFALIVAEDEFHGRADAAFGQANRDRWRLVTTNAVLYEAYTLLLVRSRPGRANALKFLDIVFGDPYRIERVRRADEDQAIALLRAHEDKGYSFCDALSFVVMERLGISEAIAYDRHFREYGRLTLI